MKIKSKTLIREGNLLIYLANNLLIDCYLVVSYQNNKMLLLCSRPPQCTLIKDVNKSSICSYVKKKPITWDDLVTMIRLNKTVNGYYFII